MRGLFALAGVVVALALAATEVGGAQAAAVPVDVSRGTLSGPLPGGFLGLALEYGTVLRWVGDPATGSGLDPALVGLIQGLDPVGRPVLRVGGQSTDRVWWPVAGMARPLGVTHNLGPSWTRAARRLAQRLDARMILSVNLEADSLAVSHVEADNLVAGVGSRYIEALEIGNEPDLYTVTPWYRQLGNRIVLWYLQAGTPVFARPLSYDQADFVAEVRRTMQVVPDLPIAGPDAANVNWLADFSSLVTPGGRVGVLDSHSYGLLACVTDPESPKYPTISNLLALSASRNLVDGAGPYVALARAAGIQFRVDEMGSVSCNGRAGVSNTMASALWATDALFTAAAEGVNGVNLHSYPGSVNGLFDLSNGPRGWSAQVHPIYYGALMFAQADPVGARLLQISAAGGDQLRTWATIGADHRVRVLLINTGGNAVATVHAPLGFGSRDASVERLVAPGLAATSGLTLGGGALA